MRVHVERASGQALVRATTKQSIEQPGAPYPLVPEVVVEYHLDSLGLQDATPELSTREQLNLWSGLDTSLIRGFVF
jgi:hypothetical protein